jgi:IPT/TIG domain
MRRDESFRLSNLELTLVGAANARLDSAFFGWPVTRFQTDRFLFGGSNNRQGIRAEIDDDHPWQISISPSWGKVATNVPVTITGSGFGDSTNASFTALKRSTPNNVQIWFDELVIVTAVLTIARGVFSFRRWGELRIEQLKI